VVRKSKENESLDKAPTARDMKARGKREARRPCWLRTPKRRRGLKAEIVLRPFQGCVASLGGDPRGDVPTKSGLAPGYYIARRWRSDSRLAIFAVGGASKGLRFSVDAASKGLRF